MRWEMQLLSAAGEVGSGGMLRCTYGGMPPKWADHLVGTVVYHRSGLIISLEREQGLRYNSGFAVPVLMS